LMAGTAWEMASACGAAESIATDTSGQVDAGRAGARIGALCGARPPTVKVVGW
jgi:hypothetical protein